MGTPPFIEIGHDYEKGNAPRAAVMLVGRPPPSQTSRPAEATTVNRRAPSPGSDTPSAVPVTTRLFVSWSHPTPAWIYIYEREEFGIFSHTALSEATLSVETSSSVSSVPFCLPSEAKDLESSVREIRSACFVFSRLAPETSLDLTKTSFGWFRKLLGQGRLL